jgi:hypothetical protein
MFTQRFVRQPRTVNRRLRTLLAPLLAVTVLWSCGLDVASAADKNAPVEALASADRRAIEKTIRDQLDAFVREDADRAFGFAAPDIQRMFGSSDNFMQMVREHYEPVYRATGVQFERLAQVDGQWVQTVRLTDDEGKVWRAFFTMRRQVDRGWKVGGCQLVETSALST